MFQYLVLVQDSLDLARTCMSHDVTLQEKMLHRFVACLLLVGFDTLHKFWNKYLECRKVEEVSQLSCMDSGKSYRGKKKGP